MKVEGAEKMFGIVAHNSMSSAMAVDSRNLSPLSNLIKNGPTMSVARFLD